MVHIAGAMWREGWRKPMRHPYPYLQASFMMAESRLASILFASGSVMPQRFTVAMK